MWRWCCSPNTGTAIPAFDTSASVPASRKTTYFALVGVERADPPIAESLRVGARVHRDDVMGLVREAQRTGLVPDGDQAVLAVGVLGAVSSFSNAWRGGHIDMSADELAEFVGDRVARDLG